jgi:hypothetical protein
MAVPKFGKLGRPGTCTDCTQRPTTPILLKERFLSGLLTGKELSNGNINSTENLTQNSCTQNHWGLWTLSIVRNPKWPEILNDLKTQCFGNWICFRLQVSGSRHLLCWIPYSRHGQPFLVCGPNYHSLPESRAGPNYWKNTLILN